MANFLRTTLVANRAEAADRVFFEDLPVNPLSMVVVTLRGVMTSADTATPLSDLLALVPALGVSFRGQDFIRGSLSDLAVVNALVCGSAPWGAAPNATAGGSWSLSVPLCFGRRPFLTKECLPAVRRGDLVLDVSVDTVVANADLIDIQIETVELLDETPESYLKYTTGGVTFGTSGSHAVRLPIGNPLLGVLLWGTTVPAGTAQTATWEKLRLKVDNVEALYAATNWASLNGDMSRRASGNLDFLHSHVHRYNGAAAAYASTFEPGRPAGVLESYAYLDFDPLSDGSYMLETAGRADVVISRDAGVADAGRYLPVELVPIRGAGS